LLRIREMKRMRIALVFQMPGSGRWVTSTSIVMLERETI